MSKLIYLHKSLRYDPTLGGLYSLYDGYTKSTLSVIDPALRTPEHVLANKKVKVCFSSSTLRTKQTAKLQFKLAKHSSLAALNEVGFDLSKLVSEDEFKIHGSKIVRERFADKFVNDTLTEKRAHIFSRIDRLLLELAKLEGDAACISHSFFMKILQADIESGKSIRLKPELIKDFLDQKNVTYPYGTGFTLLYNSKSYSILKKGVDKND